MPKMDVKIALEKVESFLKEVDELLRLSYHEGQDKKRELDTRIQNFIRIAFEDGEHKLRDYRSSVHSYIGIIGVEESEKEKQEDYEMRLKRMRDYLLAYKDELQLKQKEIEIANNLKQKRSEVEKLKKEAERRKAVVEMKIYGAMIEFIDMLREELKQRNQVYKEIATIKAGISRIIRILEEMNSRLQRVT